MHTSLLKPTTPAITFPGDGSWPYDNAFAEHLRQPDPDIVDLHALGIQANIAAIVRRGPHNPDWLAPLLHHLSPETVRQLIADPQNVGLHVPDEAQRERLVVQAAWHHEVGSREALPEELNDHFIVRDYGGHMRVGHWDDRGDFRLQKDSEFVKAHAEKLTTWFDDAGELKTAPLAKVWLKSPRTPRFDRVEFLPGQIAPPRVMNLWRGWRLRTDVTDDRPYEPIWCERFLEHVRSNICSGNDKIYAYLLGWMADALQNVHRTSEVAVVLRGPQGSGKTFFAERFLEFFAPHTLILNSPKHLTGNFNAHLRDKCMVFADEAFFAGHRQDANSLKTLITGGEIFIEPKGVDGAMAPKRFRLIMSSNDEHVVRAEGDDRRFLVLDVDAGKHNQDRDYFAKINEEWRSGGREALFRWLRGAHWRKKFETGEWDVGLRPQTDALNRQKDLSLSKAERAVHNMLLAGEVPCPFGIDAQAEKVFVPTRLLTVAEKLSQTDETALGARLRVLAGDDAVSTRAQVMVHGKGQQLRGFWLPPLAECRRHWEAHLNRAVEWPADVQTWALSEPVDQADQTDNIPF